MTDKERREQRISFALGSVRMHNPSVTREQITRIADRMAANPKILDDLARSLNETPEDWTSPPAPPEVSEPKLSPDDVGGIPIDSEDV
jgi:hypothetical protein